MAFTNSIFFVFALLICSVFAMDIMQLNVTDVDVDHPKRIHLYPIENPEELIDITHNERSFSPNSNNEDAHFVVEKYQTGFARLVQVGIKVHKGSSGTLRFRIRARGIDSSTLSENDSSFSHIINTKFSQEYKHLYSGLKEKYNGGLNVPWAEFLGFNFNEKFTLDKAAGKLNQYGEENYSSLTNEASKFLNKYTSSQVTIRGKLDAKGVSFIPTTALAFLKFSKVEFGDNQSTNVFSSSSSDLTAATPGGSVVPSENAQIEDIQILEPHRR